MRQKHLNQFRSLREEIAALCIVKCRMSHERVVRDASGLPVICRFPEGNYQRVGLCAPEVRAKRLGCSHTTARIKLEDAINVLVTSHGENNSSSLRMSREFVWLNNAIHLLDHRKGEAEKEAARILAESHQGIEPVNNEEKLKEAEKGICELEELHDEYVERIGELRDSVIKEMDKLLSEEKATEERSVANAIKT